jgi:HEAT repeat protein
MNTAWALGELKDRRAIEALSGLAADSEGPVRRLATEALNKLGAQGR